MVNVVTLGEVGLCTPRLADALLTAREMRGVEDAAERAADSDGPELPRSKPAMVGRMIDRLAAARNRLGLAAS